MSLPVDIKRRCFVCGKESTQTVLASSNTFGPSDLDMRPPSMLRETMDWWLEECPHCGYVSKSLNDITRVTREWLKSDSYLSCDNLKFESELAERFYRAYLIKVADHRMMKAFSEVLHAAWACDDAHDDENAIVCRKKALALLDEHIAMKPNDNHSVLRADLLRRTGQFDKLIAEYSDKKYSDDTLNRIIAFQIKKAKQKDVRCYTVADAFSPFDI